MIFLSLAIQGAVSFRLVTHFRLNGALFIDYDNGPIGMSRHYYLRFCDTSGASRRITDIRSLRGYVTLKDDRDALFYVRIYGSPITTGCDLELKGDEVHDRATANLDYFFGSNDYRRFCLSYPSPQYALVTKSLQKAEGLHFAKVKPLDDHWVISRTIAFVGDGKWWLEDVRESVWPDGRYEREQDKPRLTPERWHVMGVA